MPPSTTAVLNIHMLGDFRMTIDGAPLPAFPTREAQLLFSFLLLNKDRLFHRDVLIDKFFSDQNPSTARKRLRNDIWRIRSVLEPKNIADGTYLSVTNREVGFNSNSSYWLDSQAFQSVIQSLSAPKGGILEDVDKKSLTKALALYRGDLLEGTDDDWCVWERERFKMLNLKGLEILMEHHANKSAWQDAILLAEKLIADDPLREHIHRRLMSYEYFAGDRPSALVRYEICAKLLNDQLNIEPMNKTKRLFEEIKNETLPVQKNGMTALTMKLPKTIVAHKELDDGLKELYNVMSQLEQLNVKLARGLELVQKERSRSTS